MSVNNLASNIFTMPGPDALTLGYICKEVKRFVRATYASDKALFSHPLGLYERTSSNRSMHAGAQKVESGITPDQ